MNVERTPMRGLGWEPQRAGAAAGASSSSPRAVAWRWPGPRGHRPGQTPVSRSRRHQDPDPQICNRPGGKAAAESGCPGDGSLLLTWAAGRRDRPARAAGEARCLDLFLGHIPTKYSERTDYMMSDCYHAPHGHNDSQTSRASQARIGDLCGVSGDVAQCADGSCLARLPGQSPSHAEVRRAFAIGPRRRALILAGHVRPSSGSGALLGDPQTGLQAPGQRFGPLPLRCEDLGRSPGQVEALPRQSVGGDHAHS